MQKRNEPKTKRQRGFTLVELLVVIAILAILATVSTVGYTAFMKDAKVSNDLALVRQFNTILESQEFEYKPIGMCAAIEVLMENQITMDMLTPVSEGYQIAYNQQSNRFVLLGEGLAVEGDDAEAPSDMAYLWVMVSSENIDEYKDKTSLLLLDGFSSGTTVTAKYGVDVGHNTDVNVRVVNETSSGHFVVCTNGGTVTLDTPHASISHFGEAQEVNVKLGTSEFYHEHGTITNRLVLEKGSVLLEGQSYVEKILIAASTMSDIGVEQTENATLQSIAATTQEMADALRTAPEVRISEEVNVINVAEG